MAPLGQGHINDTWLVTVPEGRYVLQRISAAVFPDPAGVARKVAAVVDHLRHRGGIVAPVLQTAANGKRWVEREDGVWRLWTFVADARTLQALERPAQGVAAGRAFGEVQIALADLPEAVPEPIPGFMQLDHYLRELDAAPPTGERQADEALTLIDARRDLAGTFPVGQRLVHGDCKVNNLLFRDDDSVACVIDLDTVMHGHWAWDFGDLARSAAADGERFDIARFAAVAEGFVGSGAAPEAREALVLAPRYVAVMLAVRFLTDHFCGDRYFKVRSRGDNLHRALAQLAVLLDMERQTAAMQAAVDGL